MAESNVEQARFNMIEQQIRPWDVPDQRILNTLAEVPREAFVPDAYRNLAFADIEIHLDHGERMMAPRVEARMLQALRTRPTDNILEIGTGSGFVTACLSTLGGQVASLDIQADFTAQARAKLEEQGIRNITLQTADAMAGPVENGPFDVIAITGSLPDPATVEPFQRQLSMGGRLFVVTGVAPAMEANLITRMGENEWHREALFETELKPLANAPEPTHFEF